MQDYKTGEQTPPPMPPDASASRPKHTTLYWAIAAVALMLLVVFALTTREPGVPMPAETPAASPMSPATPGAPPSSMPEDPAAPTSPSPGSPVPAP